MLNCHFDEKVECGTIYVALRKLEENREINVGGFVLAEKSFENGKLGLFQVESIGSIAADETGLAVGDIVFADTLASFYHSEPVCLMRYDNIILKTNREKTDFWPLSNKIVVECEQGETTKVGGLWMQREDTVKTGVIVKQNLKKPEIWPFKIGDRVLLTKKGGTFVAFGMRQLFIYNGEDILCKILN